MKIMEVYNDSRFGFALICRYGRGPAKSWDRPYPAAAARHLPLFVMEASTSLGNIISNALSLANFCSFAGLTVEIACNRTFCYQRRELDFQYDQFFLGTVFSASDLPVNTSEIAHNFTEPINDGGLERL